MLLRMVRLQWLDMSKALGTLQAGRCSVCCCACCCTEGCMQTPLTWPGRVASLKDAHVMW